MEDAWVEFQPRELRKMTDERMEVARRVFGIAWETGTKLDEREEREMRYACFRFC